MERLEASVIIPTYNRPGAVQECLDALARQTVAPGGFEVIVVDDGSHPPIELDAARWAHAFALRLVRQENAGPGAARNRGVAAARGELLAFTDDDCLPTPHWLESLLGALRTRPRAMVGGSTFNGLKKNVCAEGSQLIVSLVYAHFNSVHERAYFFASNNIACQRTTYLATGGFDPSFPLGAAEDRELCDRWRQLDLPLFWIPEARLEHRHGQTLRGFLALHFRYGSGAFFYQLIRKRRGSGSMSADLGFHRALAGNIWRHLRDFEGLRQKGRLLCLLMLWQMVNAAGFFYAMWRPARELRPS